MMAVGTIFSFICIYSILSCIALLAYIVYICEFVFIVLLYILQSSEMAAMINNSLTYSLLFAITVICTAAKNHSVQLQRSQRSLLGRLRRRS